MIKFLTDDFFDSLADELSRPWKLVRVLAYVINMQFYKKYYRSSWTFNRLIHLHKEGARVQIILDSSPAFSHNHRANFFTSKRMMEIGIPLRMQALDRPQHSKLFLLGDEIAFTGSHNLTEGSLTSPHELSVRIKQPDLVRNLAALFDDLWTSEKSKPWTRRKWPKSQRNQ